MKGAAAGAAAGSGRGRGREKPSPRAFLPDRSKRSWGDALLEPRLQ